MTSTTHAGVRVLTIHVCGGGEEVEGWHATCIRAKNSFWIIGKKNSWKKQPENMSFTGKSGSCSILIIIMLNFP